MDSFLRDLIQNHRRKKSFAGGDVHMGDQKSERRTISAHGFHALYLGKVPTHHSSSEEHTQLCVEKLLDICNMNETFIDEVFLDIKSFALIMHYVDITSKVIDTKLFDLARISYCSAGHFEDPRIFAWIYRQETEEGFQLECHAVRCKTIRKTKIIVYQLYDAMTKLFVEVQAALQASETFKKARGDGAPHSPPPPEPAGKTVRFDDRVQRIDFEVDDSSSEGDDSVFYDNDPTPQTDDGETSEETSFTDTSESTIQVDKIRSDDEEPSDGLDMKLSEDFCKETHPDTHIADSEEEISESENRLLPKPTERENSAVVAELECSCTPLLEETKHQYRLVEVDNPCFEADNSSSQEYMETEDIENGANIIPYSGYDKDADTEELEDSASSGFGEDEHEDSALTCFQDIAL